MDKVKFDEMYDRLEKVIEIEQTRNELWDFIDWLNKNYPVIEGVIEIGVYHGGTAHFWNALLSPTGLYIGIDTGEWGYIPSVKESFKGDDRMQFIIGDSASFLSIQDCKMKLQNKKVDILFIDGNHGPAYVRADYWNYKQFVKPNGLIVFHDIESTEIRWYFNEFKKNPEYDVLEFVGRPGYNGIGVLIKK
jgi:cephalosporin hydroxylase